MELAIEDGPAVHIFLVASGPENVRTECHTIWVSIKAWSKKNWYISFISPPIYFGLNSAMQLLLSNLIRIEEIIGTVKQEMIRKSHYLLLFTLIPLSTISIWQD